MYNYVYMGNRLLCWFFYVNSQSQPCSDLLDTLRNFKTEAYPDVEFPPWPVLHAHPLPDVALDLGKGSSENSNVLPVIYTFPLVSYMNNIYDSIENFEKNNVNTSVKHVC